uniref:Uncharacterized protein n=1 Tax=Pyxicephalus adspersus TaxID=30357 RepID=A0AAV3AI59_PYXAD|nr:TPA: hypothetical protein GDO54_011812 [Pyxicephalus adspersus]
MGIHIVQLQSISVKLKNRLTPYLYIGFKLPKARTNTENLGIIAGITIRHQTFKMKICRYTDGEADECHIKAHICQSITNAIGKYKCV